jgi:hypothetical protein
MSSLLKTKAHVKLSLYLVILVINKKYSTFRQKIKKELNMQSFLHMYNR